MERNRIIAIACAVIATLLVIIAGKSCTDKAIKEKNKPATTTTATVTSAQQTTSQGSIQYFDIVTTAVETDLFGNPVNHETQTTVSYDIFGNPVTQASTDIGTMVATGENGEPVTTTGSGETTVPFKVETDIFGFPITTAPEISGDGETTTTATKYPEISGYNHGEDHDDTPPVPTLPSDFVITVG